MSEQRVALWDAINRVVAASGGNTACTSVARQLAVVEVDRAVDAAVAELETERNDLRRALRRLRAAVRDLAVRVEDADCACTEHSTRDPPRRFSRC